MSAPLPFPAELTPELRDVLSLMLWHTTPIAHAMRAAGQDIPRKAEVEQAVVLHHLVRLALEHGPAWRAAAAAWLDGSRATMEAAQATSPATTPPPAT